MTINWKSPMAIFNALLVFLALSILAALMVLALAMGVDMVAPGWGARIKSWFPIRY